MKNGRLGWSKAFARGGAGIASCPVVRGIWGGKVSGHSRNSRDIHVAVVLLQQISAIVPATRPATFLFVSGAFGFRGRGAGRLDWFRGPP